MAFTRMDEEGIAVLLFDYRNFGESEGEPRNLVWPSRHLQDWKAAVAYARTLEGIDPAKLALWGSSFSGGHVIVTASRDRSIAAIIAQVPFVCGLSSAAIRGPGFIIQAVFKGSRDLFRILTFRSPYYIPVVGNPSTFAVMNTPESQPGYTAIVPPQSTWKNECPARIMLALPFYRPIACARKVTCPSLIIVAENDSIIPPAPVAKTATRMRKAEVIQLPVGHFDVYTGENFELVIRKQIDFLKKCFTPTP